MKGIILTGGTGSRLYPLTKITNKCLLPVGNSLMIFRMLDVLIKSGIDDIMLVTGPEHIGHIASVLGSGSDFGCSITYRVQDKPNGIASALNLCKEFVNGEKFSVILGDNIFEDNEEVSFYIREFFESQSSYRLFSKKVKDPSQFGVPVFKNGKVIDIVEKPSIPPSDIAIVGVYCYSPEVFEIINSLKPSSKNEYEISDVNSQLVKNSSGDIVKLKCQWIDAGTHDSYRRVNEMLWRKS